MSDDKVIGNIALGFWTVVKAVPVGVGVGIMLIGLGLYYAVTALLVPSCAWKYCDLALKSDGSNPYLATVTCFIPALHLGMIIGSVITVSDRGATSITDKLISGWLGFYVLNIFYLIGTEVRGSKKVS